MTKIPIPIACTLDSGAFAERLAAWKAVIGQACTGRHSLPDGFELRFLPLAREELERLVAGERECCAWADWVVEDAGEELVLRATSSASEALLQIGLQDLAEGAAAG